MGQFIHAQVAKNGFERDASVSSTLVDMYVKGGLVREAWAAFKSLPVKDMVSWTALIMGHAYQGDCEAVVNLIGKMKDKDVMSDGVTVLSLLTACSHGGLVDEGQKCFEVLSKELQISSTPEQYNSVIDLLARAGQLTRAYTLLRMAPLQPCLMSWIIMLGACRNWGDAKLGVQAFNFGCELVGRQAAPYILMFNLFTDTVVADEREREH